MKARSERSLRRLLLDLSALFAFPILDADECLVISREADVFRHALSFPGDPVGFEAFVNHVHLDDVLASAAGKLSRKDLLRIGELVVQVWSDRLKGLLRGREVLFYLGGPKGVTLRFHVVREGAANWLDLHDKLFIQKEKMRIFRLNEAGSSEETASGAIPGKELWSAGAIQLPPK
jgi:hypothetical protein